MAPKIKIVFLNPPFKTEYGRFSRTSRSPAIAKSGTLYYPIWLCYAAGVAEDAGYHVKIIDSCAYEYDHNKTIQLLEEYSPQMVVLDTSTPSIYSDAAFCSEIKKILPSCFTVLIGTHPTALPEETLQIDAAIDAVIVGEADFTVKELADVISKANTDALIKNLEYKKGLLSPIDGLAYRVGDSIVVNKKRELIADLDQLPFLSKIYQKHLDPKKYFFAASDYPMVHLMSARGCVAKCTFCVYPQTIHEGKYRFRSAKNMADEFEWIKENMKDIREVGFEDDTFTGNKKRVREFCMELITRKIKLKWYCNSRIDIDLDTMKLMKRAGCVLTIVGYESANRDVLKNIQKRINPEQIFEFSKNARKSKLLVHGCFMIGNRGDNKQTIEETLKLALKLKDDTVQFFPLIVYPGTVDYEWAKHNGLYSVKNYSDYLTEDGLHNSVVEMPDMNSDQIREWCNYARKKYYLRFSYIFYKICRITLHPSELRRTVIAFKNFVRFLIN